MQHYQMKKESTFVVMSVLQRRSEMTDLHIARCLCQVDNSFKNHICSKWKQLHFHFLNRRENKQNHNRRITRAKCLPIWGERILNLNIQISIKKKKEKKKGEIWSKDVTN